MNPKITANINWQQVPRYDVSYARLNRILDALERIGYTRTNPSKRRNITSIAKMRRQYYFTKEGNAVSLHVIITFSRDAMVGLPGQQESKFIFYSKPVIFRTLRNVDKADDTVTGWEAYRRTNDIFKAKTKTTISDALGYDKRFRETSFLVKNCVPQYICWANPEYNGRMLSNCYKTDVSSAFPSEGAKPLPTYAGHMVKQGIIEPNSEYPFAFYPSRGSLKIYGEDIDTGEYHGRPEYELSANSRKTLAERRKHITEKLKRLTLDDEITILMKAYTGDGLKNTFELLYAGRKEHPVYKQYMNLFLGYFHLNERPFLSPAAAVIIARCGARMIKAADELKRRGNTPIMINVDSISWQGKAEPDLYTREKAMGNLVIEHENALMIVCGAKKYQIYNPETGETKTTYAGHPKPESEKMAFGDILEKQFDEPDEIRYINNRFHLVKHNGREAIDTGRIQ